MKRYGWTPMISVDPANMSNHVRIDFVYGFSWTREE